MLRMPTFEVHLPRSGAEAVSLRNELPNSTYVAGGTDLLPNLKHGLAHPDHLISLSHVTELKGIESLSDGTLRIGAGTPLQTVADDSTVRDQAPALASAAGSVAGPQHRRMGTLGGNVMLDTRCLFYNQSEFWRDSLGYCLKKDGDFCHVIDSPARCVAAQSADTVPVLIALDAVIEFASAQGPQEIDLGKLYTKDGRLEQVFSIDAEALVTAIRIPPRQAGHRSIYRKVRSRDAVDFPQLGLALVGVFDEAGVVTSLAAVFSAILPQPRRLRGLEVAVGTRLQGDIIDRLAQLAVRQVTPQTSLHGAVDWRKEMAGVEMQRGLLDLRESR